MSASMERRVSKLEQKSDPERMTFTLEQLVHGSLGVDPGRPVKALGPGEVSLEDLIVNATPLRGAP